MVTAKQTFPPIYITLLILDLFYAFFSLISLIRLFQIISYKHRKNISILYYITIFFAMISRGIAFLISILNYLNKDTQPSTTTTTFQHLFLLTPDMIHICLLFILFWHFFAHYILSHINVANDVNVFKTKEQDIPKLQTTTNYVLYIVIPIYFILCCIICILFAVNKITSIEFIITNGCVGLATPFILSGYYIFLNVKFSGKPYKSKLLEKESTHILAVISLWSINRVVVGLIEILFCTVWFDYLKNIITQIDNLNILKCIFVVCFFIISEFIPIYLSLDSGIMKTFSTSHSANDYDDDSNTHHGDIENILNNSQRVPLFDPNSVDDSVFSRSRITQVPKVDFKEIVIESLNEITIKEEIHSHKNSLGIIYKGEYHNKPVVCRVINFDRLSRYDLESVSKDIEIILSISHTLLCSVVGIHIDNDKNQIIILTSYYSNGSLYDYIHERKSQLTFKSKIEIALTVAKGLKYLNEFNLNHCHLSSKNILLQDDLTPLIADYGFVSLHQLAEIFNKYHNKNSYSSPEVLKDERSIGHVFSNYDYNERIDVYSFGILLWEIMTQVVPFNVKMKELYDYVVEQKCRPEITKDIDGDIAELIRMCWDSEVKSRPKFDEIITILNNKLLLL